MEQETMFPLIHSPYTIDGDSASFNLLDKLISLECPQKLLEDLLILCNGSTSYTEIIAHLNQDWDQETLKDLINNLISLGVLINSGFILSTMYSLGTNPTRFFYSDKKVDAEALAIAASERTLRKQGRAFKVNVSNSPTLTNLQNRESTRSFSGELISFEQLTSLIWSGYGNHTICNKGFVHKTVPSAGALFPLKLFLCLLQDIHPLKSGVYAISFPGIDEVAFEKISDDICYIKRSFIDPTCLFGACGIIFISGDFVQSCKKYSNRGMIYTLLEAGHVAQNVQIYGCEQKIATVEIGGYISSPLKEHFNGLDPLTSVVFGKAKNSTENQSTIPFLNWSIPLCGNYHPPFAIASAKVSENRSWAHGRDADPEVALIKAISEAKEWASCENVPNTLIQASFNELSNVMDPQKIISFAPHQYTLDDFPFKPFSGDNSKYEWCWSNSLFTEVKTLQLADLVYYPYYPKSGSYYCFCNSSGVAAHPNPDIAMQSSLLELMERDAFMVHYLTGMTPKIVDIHSLPLSLQMRVHHLKDNGFDCWIIDHSLEYSPVMSVFVQNHTLCYTGCASSSNFDLENAIEHALTEVEASILYRLQTGSPKELIPEHVDVPVDHGALYQQHKFYRQADFMLKGDSIKFSEVAHNACKSWESLLDTLKDLNQDVFYVQMNLSPEYDKDNKLYIYRALVPGLVPMTFGFCQEALGNSRIYQVAKSRGIILTPQQIRTLPHPFA